MRLILHIGTEKTGTTTFQNFFAQNREALRTQKIWYPTALGHNNHVLLPVIARDPDKPDELFAIFGISSIEDHRRRAQEAKRHFETEFEIGQLCT